LQLGDVSKVALVVKLSLVLIAVFAVMFLHERPTMQEWVGASWLAPVSSSLGSSDERARVRAVHDCPEATALA
jgi:drug/metabolite transporter (DMT)-like permease